LKVGKKPTVRRPPGREIPASFLIAFH